MASPVLIDSSLDIFNNKPILQTFLQTRKIKIRPIDGWKMGSDIIFVVPKLESSLLESNSFEIVMTSQIQTADNKDPDDTVMCAPLNAAGLLAFESISCQIGSEYICGDNRWDVYKVWYNLVRVNVTIFTFSELFSTGSGK